MARGGQLAALQDGQAVGQVPVDVGMMMVVVMFVRMEVFVDMVMLMRMFVFMVVMIVGGLLQVDVEVAGRDAALGGPGDVEVPTVQVQAFQGSAKDGFVGSQVQQSGGSHVSADAGGTFKVKGFHRISSCFPAMSRLIWAAE